MSKSLIGSYDSELVSTGTYYLSVGDYGKQAAFNEALAERPVRHAGDFIYMATYVSQHNSSGTTLTLRKSRVDTSLTISITGTGYWETTGSVAFANTDEVNYKFVVNSNSTTHKGQWVVFEPTTSSNCITFPATNGNSNTAGTDYCAIQGHLALDTETSIRTTLPLAATASNYYVYGSNNSTTDYSLVRFRKNNANGNGIAFFDVSQSGAVEDTSNTDSISDGDTVNWQLIGNADGFSVQHISCLFNNSSGKFLLLNQYGADLVRSTDATAWTGLQGHLSVDTTEDFTEVAAPFAMTASRMTGRIETNSGNNQVVATLRKNAAATALSLTWTAAEVSIESDTENVSIALDATINFEINSDITSGIARMQYLALVAEEVVAAAVFPELLTQNADTLTYDHWEAVPY